MRARRAEFVKSAAAPKDYPPPGAPEIAFAGRSNVGKSSLLNALCGVNGLARTSSTPGHTRLLNWFQVVAPDGADLAFVDLPGYGFARVSRAMRASWRPLVEAYIERRDVLRLVIVIVDARRGPEEEERELLAWLAEHERPALVVLTKTDKLTKAHRRPAQEKAKRELGLRRLPLMYSAKSGEGQEDLWDALGRATRSQQAV